MACIGEKISKVNVKLKLHYFYGQGNTIYTSYFIQVWVFFGTCLADFFVFIIYVVRSLLIEEHMHGRRACQKGEPDLVLRLRLFSLFYLDVKNLVLRSSGSVTLKVCHMWSKLKYLTLYYKYDRNCYSTQH